MSHRFCDSGRVWKSTLHFALGDPFFSFLGIILQDGNASMWWKCVPSVLLREEERIYTQH